MLTKLFLFFYLYQYLVLIIKLVEGPQLVLAIGVADNNGKKFKVTSLGEGREPSRFLVVGVSSTSPAISFDGSVSKSGCCC